MPRFAKIDEERKITEVREAESAPKAGGQTWEPVAAHLRVGDILPAPAGAQAPAEPEEDDEPA